MNIYIIVAVVWIAQCGCFYLGTKIGERKERKKWNELIDKGIIPKPGCLYQPHILARQTVNAESAASKVLRDKTNSKAAKTAAGSALNQPIRKGK